MVWFFVKGFEINLSKTEFVKYLWVLLYSFCEFSLPFLKLSLVLISVKKILSKKTRICDKYRCFFVRLNAPYRIKYQTCIQWHLRFPSVPSFRSFRNEKPKQIIGQIGGGFWLLDRVLFFWRHSISFCFINSDVIFHIFWIWK